MEYFRERESQSSTGPFQTHINETLRSVAEGSQFETRDIKMELLKDKEFLRELEERLMTYRRKNYFQ